MPKATKVILWISVFCLVFGIILAGVGAAFGGMRPMTFGLNRGLRIYEPFVMVEDEYSFDARSADSLSIEVNACRFEISEGSELAVFSRYDPAYWDFTAELVGGELTVRLIASPSLMLGFDAFRFDDSNRALVYITVPRNTGFDRVDLLGDACAIEIEALQADDLALTFNAASVNAANIDCANLSLEMSAGGVYLDGVKASQSATVTLSAGEVKLSDASVKGLTLEVGAGSATYEGVISGENHVQLAAGSASLDLRQPESSLDISINVSAGEASVNGRSFSGLASSGNAGSSTAANKLTIEVEVGSVQVETR